MPGMGKAGGRPPHDDAVIGALAARQHRLVRGQQLREAGLSPSTIRHRVAAGRLIPVVRGVYLVGVPILDQTTLIQAALLHAGPGAAASHQTAAELHRVLPVRTGVVTVSTPRKGLRSPVRTLLPMTHSGRPGLIEIRTSGVLAAHTTVADRLRATTVARTLVDVAGSRPELLKRAWREAEFLQLLEPDALAATVASARRKGNTAVGACLEEHVAVDPGPHGFDTVNELDAVKLLQASGVPRSFPNYWIEACGTWRRIDLFFPDARLAVEIDGWTGHRSRRSFEDDPVRDSDLLTVGILTSRYTAKKLTDDPQFFVSRVSGLLRARAGITPRADAS